MTQAHKGRRRAIAATFEEDQMTEMTQNTISRQSREDVRRDLEHDETTNLISSDKVDGTAVYATDGEKIGHVDHLMIGKRNGRVEYAVMSFGGFLGLGESYHPLPWDALDYDTEKGGYVVSIDKSKLKEAPYYMPGGIPAYDRNYGTHVHGFYGMVY